MAKILIINGSLTLKSQRGSISNAILALFKKTYLHKNPQDEIIEINLNELPMAQETLTSENIRTFWTAANSQRYITQLQTVDKVILTAPMTSFNYPATVKNYFDHILVAKKTFAYKYDAKGGSVGYLDHLKVQLIMTQGAPKGWYPFANHTLALEGTWKFVGANVVPSLVVAGTKIPANITKSPAEMIAPFQTMIIAAARKF